MNLFVRPMVNTPPLYIGVTLATFKASGKNLTSSEQRFISGLVLKCPGVDSLPNSIFNICAGLPSAPVALHVLSGFRDFKTSSTLISLNRKCLIPSNTVGVIVRLQ